MSFSGALGRGTYRRAIAGAENTVPARYHACADELIQLKVAHREVTRKFLVRDKIFDNKFSSNRNVNGLFKMSPTRRDLWHFEDLCPDIRRRSIWMKRILQQRAINKQVEEDAERRNHPHPASSFVTADANAYFQPKSATTVNHWPNFWQHPSAEHVVPRPQWQRHPELDGITRVGHTVTHQANDY